MNKFITIPLFFILFNLNAQNYYQKNYDSLNKVLETINKKINELQNQKISIEDRIKTFAERLSNKTITKEIPNLKKKQKVIFYWQLNFMDKKFASRKNLCKTRYPLF